MNNANRSRNGISTAEHETLCDCYRVRRGGAGWVCLLADKADYEFLHLGFSHALVISGANSKHIIFRRKLAS